MFTPDWVSCHVYLWLSQLEYFPKIYPAVIIYLCLRQLSLFTYDWGSCHCLPMTEPAFIVYLWLSHLAYFPMINPAFIVYPWLSQLVLFTYDWASCHILLVNIFWDEEVEESCDWCIFFSKYIFMNWWKKISCFFPLWNMMNHIYTYMYINIYV